MIRKRHVHIEIGIQGRGTYVNGFGENFMEKVVFTKALKGRENLGFKKWG